MRQKGNNFVEYALMLGLVVGIGWGVLGSYGDGIPGIFGSAAELLQAGSKSDKVYDRHMKWLKDSLLALAQKEPGNGVQSVFDYMGGTNGSYFDQRKGPEFTTPNGIIDSDSWAMVGYKENGKLYYAVAIYSPDKNGGIKLADQPVGAKVTTDVYRVDPNATADAITRLDSSVQMKVGENTRKDGTGTKYHVLRDLK